MNVESKVWNFSGNGTKIHAYINGRNAACRSNIARPAGEDMDYCKARQAFKFSLCTTCDAKFNAAIERAETSMQPSTGEGDHLPPAEDTNAPARVRTEDLAPGDRVWGDRNFIEVGPYPHELELNPWNTGTAMRITGTDFDGNPAVLDALASKEWIRDRTPAVQRTTTATANEEDSLPIDNGPLTERQTAIIGHVRAGLRYRKVAEQLGISEVLVRREVVAITRKLRAITFQQAIGIYATARAYLKVADVLDGTSRAHLEQDGVAEDHVNHVLMMLANEYRSRAARLLPQ